MVTQLAIERSGEAEFGLDLSDRRIGGGSAIVENEGRHRLVPSVDGLDEGCGLRIVLNVDLLEGDALAGHLRL